MKSVKIKNFILAACAAVLLCAACLVFTAGGTASAAEPEYSGNNFTCTVGMPAGGNASVTFGEDESGRFSVTLDRSNRIIKLEKTAKTATAGRTVTETVEELKRVSFDFGEGEAEIVVVVNEGAAKVFAGGNVANLVCKLEGYAGGAVKSTEGEIKNFVLNDTHDGDIFVGGYTVERVVNLTDGNYILKTGEYTFTGGAITVSDSYLKTLEAGVDYRFRAVTAFTDYDFTINTAFAAVSVAPAIEKFYRGTDITLEVFGDVTVDKLLIDGKEFKFKTTNGRVVISADDAAALATGKHEVKLFTDRGRPETSINVSEKVETITEPEEVATHVFFWIDIAIFGSAIIGYAIFTIVGKRKGK